MMKQITADLKRLVKADPGKHQSVIIAAVNQNVDVNFQYNGEGMYRCLLRDPNTHKSIKMTPWVNSVTLLERSCAAEGIELANQRSDFGHKGRKSIFLYVDGDDYGMDVVDLALVNNKTVDAVKRELERHFAPAQVQFKIEVR